MFPEPYRPGCLYRKLIADAAYSRERESRSSKPTRFVRLDRRQEVYEPGAASIASAYRELFARVYHELIDVDMPAARRMSLRHGVHAEISFVG